jgi:trans-aconitate 2-methyltransferase
VSPASWDPDQYRRFADERAAPFHDLLALLDEGPTARVVDLGCGPGELTALAADRLAATDVLGVDNSPAMLGRAAKYADDRTRFVEGDIAQWTSAGDIDVVIAAASLQWVSDHPGVLARWAAALAPGGQMIVQVPANAHAATHTVASALAEREPYRTAFGTAGAPADPVAANVLAPEQYSRVLYDLGFAQQRVELRVYPHVLESTRAAVEWVKGTNLTRFARLLTPDMYARFLEEYEHDLLAALGDQRPLFFPFNRILLWARAAS